MIILVYEAVAMVYSNSNSISKSVYSHEKQH